MTLPFNPKLVQSKESIFQYPSKVGQAVYDILKGSEAPPTVEEVLNEFAPKYESDFYECVRRGHDKFKKPFYVFVLSNKEPWATNVQRCFFIDRNTPPHASDMMLQYPNHFKTLYLINGNLGKFKVLWSLPGEQDCISVLKNKQIYSPDLVQWIIDSIHGKNDKDSYDFEEFSMVS